MLQYKKKPRTFRSISGNRYRCIQTQEITRNPEKVLARYYGQLANERNKVRIAAQEEKTKREELNKKELLLLQNLSRKQQQDYLNAIAESKGTKAEILFPPPPEERSYSRNRSWANIFWGD